MVQEQSGQGGLKDRKQSFFHALKSFGLWLGLTLLFILIIGGLRGLYGGTQPYHFLIGLAKAGRGELASDWFAQTANPWVLFAFLVQFTAQYLGEPFFYLYQVFLIFIYLYSLIGIADHFFDIRRDHRVFFIFLSVYITSYAVFWPDKLGYLLYSGVATQDIPFEILIPNSFGAFLLFSIYLFFKQKPAASILSIAVACYFHPAYLIVGASLVAGYLLIMYLDGQSIKQIAIFGGSALLIILPLVMYFFSSNSGATQAQIHQATDITVNFRIPQHTIVKMWWDKYAFIRFLIVLGALVAARKNRLFYVLLVGFLFVAVPTIVLAIRPSNTLGALMLWRPSVVVIPLATTTLIASWVSAWYRDNQADVKAHWGWVMLSLIVLMSITLVDGINQQLEKIERTQSRQTDPLYLFVKENLQPGDQYLIPPKNNELSVFRLETGAPILVDWNLNPWGALDTIEWYQRYQLAEKFYSIENEDSCSMLPEFVDIYAITHVVVPVSLNMECPGWTSIFEGDKYKVLAISSDMP